MVAAGAQGPWVLSRRKREFHRADSKDRRCHLDRIAPHNRLVVDDIEPYLEKDRWGKPRFNPCRWCVGEWSRE